MCFAKRDSFGSVIWSDESSVHFTHYAQTIRVKIGRDHVLKPNTKHAHKVHIWAAISRKGAVQVWVFDQTIDGPLYDSILKFDLLEFVLPFLMVMLPEGDYWFMQKFPELRWLLVYANVSWIKVVQFIDYICVTFNGIKWWPTLTNNAVFNPIEWVWRELKHFIARNGKPLSKKELIEGICLFCH